jgi:hypothetical protein
MPIRPPAYLEDILAAIAAQLATATGIPQSSIHMTLDPDDMPPIKSGTTIITYTPRDFPLDQAEYEGVGRVAPTFDGTIDVTLWIRMHLDQPGRSETFMTDQTKGAIQLMRKVMGNAAGRQGQPPHVDTLPPTGLLGFDPTDDQGNGLLKQEMRLRPGGWRTVPGQQETGWRRIVSSWECMFVQKLP